MGGVHGPGDGRDRRARGAADEAAGKFHGDGGLDEESGWVRWAPESVFGLVFPQLVSVKPSFILRRFQYGMLCVHSRRNSIG